ncbi:hypothetical protein HG530_013102 [Fusarium avenaceum]|nr:hypothetical protein HG530_013102 [Fusarium avenaceum]
MDPASIIGTTSAAITFVETLAKIASVARKVHHATDELDEHKRLRDIASALEPATTALIDKSKSQISLSPVEKSLLEVTQQCQDVSKRIIHLLDSYQVGPVSQTGHSSPSPGKSITGLSSLKKSVKATFRIIRGEREEEGLRQDFDRCNRLLNIHLALISKSEILERIDVVFVKYRQETSADFKSIRDTLQTTLLDIQKQSKDLIKQVNFVKVKLDEVVDSHDGWLQQISKLRKLLETSHQTVEQIKHHQILKAIAFHDMRMRRHQIGNVELAEDTFEWMVKDETVPPSHPHLKQSFASWLKEGKGIFHITGKPGSGKSTMMNFLANHPVTRKHLELWARNRNRILIASMFLWNPGSAQQKSVDGVCRTLLYTILNYQKDLIPHAFASLWNAYNEELLMSRQHLEISNKEIGMALQKLITDSTQGYQYCFFIDGLDEIEDESRSNFIFATELCNWARYPSVKLCLSSREERPWTNYFEGFPKLKIHLTTEQDIRKMIDNYLLHDRHLKNFPATESEKFVTRFVSMAEGVFIWVKLVLRELEESLNYELPLSTLHHVLDTFPQDLDEFYDTIIRRIPQREKSLAHGVFDWTIRNSLVWRTNEIFRATAIALHSSPNTSRYRSPDEGLKILLSDEFGPNFWYSHPSLPCPISPWTRFLFYFMAQRVHKSSTSLMSSSDKLWRVLSEFVESKADLDLVLSWTLQKTRASPRRFYIKDIRVGNRLHHDNQTPKIDTLFYKGTKFYVSRDFRMKFPRGGSAREILVHFAPEKYLALLY